MLKRLTLRVKATGLRSRRPYLSRRVLGQRLYVGGARSMRGRCGGWNHPRAFCLGPQPTPAAWHPRLQGLGSRVRGL